MNNAKKERKIIDRERLKISLRKLDIKGTFHAKMGTIQDRNGKDLTAEEIKKTWQEHTELYKKGLNNPDNHDGVVTHLKPDILEREVSESESHSFVSYSLQPHGLYSP